MTRRLADSPGDNISIQRFSDPKNPWFYLHVKDTIAKGAGPTTETIPLAEYLFRYDQGGFASFDYGSIRQLHILIFW